MPLRDPDQPAPDAIALALGALGWVLADQARAQRLLDLTGLSPEALRASLADPHVLAPTLMAVLDFLAAHEPDLTAAAEALGTSPAALVAARQSLA